MEKRLILALILSFIILVLFGRRPPPPPPQEEAPDEAKIERLLEEAVYEDRVPQGFEIEGPLYSVFISKEGGIRSYRLKEYKGRKVGIPRLKEELNIMVEKAREQLRRNDTSSLYLIKKLRYTINHLKTSYGENKGVELISFGELYHHSLPPFIEIRDENNNVIWKEKDPYGVLYKGKKKIHLSQNIPQGLRIDKLFFFNPHSYLINLKIVLENTTSYDFPSYHILLTCGPDVGGVRGRITNIGIDEGIHTHIYRGALIFMNGELKRVRLDRGEERMKEGDMGWVALQDEYFAKILIPYERVKKAYLTKNQWEEYTVGLHIEVPSLTAGERWDYSFGIYLGPKRLESLKKIERGVERMVEHGFFGDLFRVVYILNFFYRLTHNYGLAIILLTIMINLILFPLSWKSFVSIKEMRKLQPEMEKIRKQFRSEPQKMNKEIIELYRRHKVNPAGGCLPMPLQMPIFIGLFTALRSAIELRDARFVGWIRDLSLPDTLMSLPFSIPLLGSNVNVLPLVMTLVTFLQQKVSGGGTGSKIMMFLPIILLFIFYNFPSGLVLYFLSSNIINVLQQLWIGRSRVKKG